ncbi:MAG: SGNH/GDSL hydrolase family protein [Desulfobacterales bacterium]|jgi:lysophospholipase L1-like esterase
MHNIIFPRFLFLFFLLLGCVPLGCASKTWDYVALGDSTPAGFGVEKSYVDYYAEFIEKDLGIQVEIHNFARSSQKTSTLLKQLQTDEEYRAALQDAEVVTLWTGWNDLGEPLSKFRTDSCGGKDNLDCIRDKVAEINKNLDGILDEIRSLTGTDTLILIADVGIPFVQTWQYQGWFDTLQGPCYEEWRNHLVQAAEKRDMKVVYTYHVLNGPNGDEKLEGIYQNDGIHLNEEGHKLLARLHREVGYEPSQ